MDFNTPPESVYMFRIFLEKIVIKPLYSITWLVSVIETQRVSCEIFIYIYMLL
jgi:hypothetical protein